VLLVDQLNLKILVLEDLLGPLDVEENVDECPDGVLVTAHHQVSKPDEVIRRHLASRHPGVHGLLVDVDVLQNVDGLIEVAEKGVQSAETDEGEISQHLVEGMHAELSSHALRFSSGGKNLELRIDVALFDEGVEDVENRVDVPDGRVSPNVGDVARLELRQVRPEETERLELVDELVDDVPEPLVGQFPVDGPVVVENEVEQAAVVVVGLVTVLEGGSVGHAGVDVTEVQLLVQDQEEWIVLTHVFGDDLRLWPRIVLEETLRQLGESVFVAFLYLSHVPIGDDLLEISEEIPDDFRDDGDALRLARGLIVVAAVAMIDLVGVVVTVSASLVVAGSVIILVIVVVVVIHFHRLKIQFAN